MSITYTMPKNTNHHPRSPTFCAVLPKSVNTALFGLLLEAEYSGALLRGREAGRFGAPAGASASKKEARSRPAKYLAPVGRGSTGRGSLFVSGGGLCVLIRYLPIPR